MTSIYPAAVMAIITVVAPLAIACQICIPIPTDSLADRLLAADTAILAREDPEKPFTFAAVEILKGNSDFPAPDLLVNSQARRRLAANPEFSVLLSRCAADSGWQHLGLIDATTEPVIRDILRLGSEWREAPSTRLAYFTPLLGSENPLLSPLAHLEVGKVGYDEIRQIDPMLTRDQLRAFIANPRMIEWHALYILLLARSEHPDDRALIRQRITSLSAYSSTFHLPAWATAFIEIDGVEAIDELAQLYFQDSTRSAEEIQAVHAALSVHGNKGREDLREPIAKTLTSLLPTHPELAMRIVDDLDRWQNYRAAPEVARLLREQSTDLTTTARLRAYLRASEPTATSSGERLEPSTSYLWLIALLAFPLLLALKSRPAHPSHAS